MEIEGTIIKLNIWNVKFKEAVKITKKITIKYKYYQNRYRKEMEELRQGSPIENEVK